MESLGRRRKQLLDDPKKTGRYCKQKEEVLDRILWRTRFGYKLWTCRKTVQNNCILFVSFKIITQCCVLTMVYYETIFQERFCIDVITFHHKEPYIKEMYTEVLQRQ